MTKVPGLCLLILVGIHAVHGSAVDFANMIRVATGKAPRQFVGYGNFCGLGGKGEVKDKIDWCCREHDRCLTEVNRGACRALFHVGFFVLDYKWAVLDNQIVCSDLNNACSAHLCECDKEAAVCMANNDHRYDPDLKRPALYNFIRLFSFSFK
ncbi:phospholipase A2, membrane associated-like [Dreissena polymorpha]|uniref:Phospholipase A2 n=1 Tax=Dreissena polymorpha TaxID=45954 RepID=A0A9D4RDR7_DREPO|nr:phospholipase A2, membrane associated-like [Dreissena polymorpha]KAH3862605.1 hypothetical protein DPMN_025574 [Dreissena polymorpha]